MWAIVIVVIICWIVPDGRPVFVHQCFFVIDGIHNKDLVGLVDIIIHGEVAVAAEELMVKLVEFF